jgi:hypothetical protein
MIFNVEKSTKSIEFKSDNPFVWNDETCGECAFVEWERCVYVFFFFFLFVFLSSCYLCLFSPSFFHIFSLVLSFLFLSVSLFSFQYCIRPPAFSISICNSVSIVFCFY